MKDLDRSLIGVFFFLTSLLLLSTPYDSYSNKLKSALKQLNKGNFEKTKKLLDKSLAKENLNPGAKYIYSLYFLNPENKASNLDSGYHYILSSIEDYKTIDEKTRKKLNKININDSTLAVQKAKIENLAFAEISTIDTEESYNTFIRKFATASEIPKAIKRRDELAFKKALEINTSKSYKDFIDKYPQSHLNSEARENYDLKLFQEATGAGTLDGYIQFLSKNPTSPYRQRAEEKVFKISTVLNTDEDYESFLKKFPDSKFNYTALTYLLYKYLDENRLEEFLKKYPKNRLTQRASEFLKRQDSIYFVFYDNQQFGFINELGGPLSEARFESVPDDYLCNGVKDEYLLYKQDDRFGAIDKTGTGILPAEYESIEKIGTGTLKVKEGDNYSLYLMNGNSIGKVVYEDIQKLNDAFLKIKSKGLWGIRGLNGCEVLDPLYNEISFIGKDFFIIKKSGKYAILTSNDLVKIAETGIVSMDFKYDEVDEMDDNYLEVNQNGKLGVIDHSLSPILPPNYKSISNTRKAWVARRDDVYDIFNLKGSIISPVAYNKVVFGKGMFAVKHKNKWGILNDAGLEVLPLEYDSIVLIGDKISLLIKGEETSAYFNFGKKIVLPAFKKVEVQTSALNTLDSLKTQFLLIEGKDGKISIFNQYGKSFLKTIYDQVTVVTENLFVVEQKGKTGIVDSTGKVRLPLKYDAIGNYSQGYVSLLKSSHFGIFNLANKVLIQPKFDALMKVFDHKRKIFLGMENGKYAFIDEKGKLLSEYKFKEASLWKGDSVLIKDANSLYSLYSLKNKEVILPYFESVKFISDTPSERLAIVYGDSKYGVFSNKSGFIVPMKYNDITNLGSKERPFFMVEHQVEEADLYVVLYINHQGQVVMSQAYKSADYEKLLCQD